MPLIGAVPQASILNALSNDDIFNLLSEVQFYPALLCHNTLWSPSPADATRNGTAGCTHACLCHGNMFFLGREHLWITCWLLLPLACMYLCDGVLERNTILEWSPGNICLSSLWKITEKIPMDSSQDFGETVSVQLQSISCEPLLGYLGLTEYRPILLPPSSASPHHN